ncbi:MFS transporter [Colwellia psychrerythraea]|uniref:Major facilitator superfamily MFS_1 n=1 Tax=Colwellia psychrerythraea TaxID=28229 RepID=A0A099KUE0_COLPS|nr:MFS transporter [Colwellia psychrerythraea]KGJ93487.1 major facilitator superfamily MFS_1 [Colwellia psychrerythraea]
MKISNKYLVETIVFISYVLFAMAWVGGTASMGQIMAAMQVDSLASASFISGAVTLAKIVGTFGAAWVAIKFGIKYAFFIASLFIVIGLLTPLAPNYELLLLSRFLMGLGGAFMIVYFNPIVMHWFTADERPVINGLNAVAFNIGTGIVLWKMADINQFTGDWKASLIIFSIASLLLSLAWLLVEFSPGNDKQGQNGTTIANYSYIDGLKDKFNWAYGLTYSGLLAFYICLFTFYPKAGISQSKWVIGFGIVGTLAGIIYSKKVPLRLPIIRWSGAVMVVTIIGVSFSSSEWLQTLSAIVLGFFIFFPITALVSIPHELPKMTGQRITVVFSLFYSISYLFSTVILWLFGKLVDINQGDYTASFILISVVSCTFFIGSFFLPETGKNKVVMSNDYATNKENKVSKESEEKLCAE